MCIPDRSVMRCHLSLDAALEVDNKLTRFWNSVCWDGIHRQMNYFRSHSCSGEHHTLNTDEWAGFYTPIHCPHHKGHLSFSHSLTLSFILLSICQKISVWLVSMAPLALRELSPGFLELLVSCGCYQKDCSSFVTIGLRLSLRGRCLFEEWAAVMMPKFAWWTWNLFAY